MKSSLGQFLAAALVPDTAHLLAFLTCPEAPPSLAGHPSASALTLSPQTQAGLLPHSPLSHPTPILTSPIERRHNKLPDWQKMSKYTVKMRGNIKHFHFHYTKHRP